jgi:hypothetical protein
MKTPARPRSVPAAKAVTRPRGRPPRPGGPTPKAEFQHAYRARLKAAGKVVKLADPSVITPDFDPDTHFVRKRAVLEQRRYDFNIALLEIARLTEETSSNCNCAMGISKPIWSCRSAWGGEQIVC